MRVVDFLGTGWSFPVLPGQEKRTVEYVKGVENVRQAIYLILETEPGERIMRPTFGCGLRRYLMKPNTTATRALIQHDVEQALTNWEFRIQLRAVQVEAGDDPAMVLINISYIHARNGREDNLVYPFYLG